MFRAMLIIGAGALLVGVVIFALVDCARTEASRVRALPKAGWLAVILLFPVVGALLWLFLGKRRGASSFGPVVQQDVPRAPDDDPEYLKFLESRARRQAESRRRAEQEKDEDET